MTGGIIARLCALDEEATHDHHWTSRTWPAASTTAPIDSAIGLNWYDADPNLQQLVERLALPDDRAFAEQQLRNMGGVIGGPVAARAEITDKNPPRLEKYDAWGNEINEIVHHQSAIDTKRDLWENGFLGLRWTDEVRKTRAGHLPPVVNTGFLYFLNQAETGMACGIGMTSSAAGIINRHAPPEIRDRFLPHLTTMDFGEAWAGGMFMTEIRGGSDLASSECAARKTRRRLAHHRLEVVLLEPRRRSDPHARAPRRRATPASPVSRSSSSRSSAPTAAATASTSAA